MRILIAGDAHANLAYMQRVVEIAVTSGASHILQVGDLGYWPRMAAGQEYLEGLSHTLRQAELELYFCDGNHEDHAMLDHNRDELVEIAEGIWHGPRGVTTTFDGVKILFMGGAVSVDRALRTAGYDWFTQEVPTEEQWQRAAQATDIDIVLAHDAPDGVTLNLEYKTGPMLAQESQDVRDKMRELCNTVKPSLWISGHYHQRSTQYLGDTTVEILDCELPAGNSTLLIDTSAFHEM